MSMNKVVSFLMTFRDFLHRIDAKIMHLVRASYAEPLMKITISKYGVMMLAFGLGMFLSTLQDATSGQHYMMVIFSLNILLMFLQNSISELSFSEHFDELPDYMKELPKDAADLRLFSGFMYMMSAIIFALTGDILGACGFLSFILMQYTAACVPDKLSAV